MCKNCFEIYLHTKTKHRWCFSIKPNIVISKCFCAPKTRKKCLFRDSNESLTKSFFF